MTDIVNDCYDRYVVQYTDGTDIVSRRFNRKKDAIPFAREQYQRVRNDPASHVMVIRYDHPGIYVVWNDGRYCFWIIESMVGDMDE